MTNRRGAIIVFALAAVMLVGIGFAAISTTINLTGYFNFNLGQVKEDYDVDISLDTSTNPIIKAYATDGTEITGLGGNVLSASIDSNDPDIGSITAKHFTARGEKVVVKYKIKNTGTTNTTATLSIAVNTETSSADKNYFNVTKKFSATEDGTDGADTYDLAPDATCWVTIEMEVIAVPTVTSTNDPANDNTATEGQVTWVITATAKEDGSNVGN